MTHDTADHLLSTADLIAAAGAKWSQAEHLFRLGVLVPETRVPDRRYSVEYVLVLSTAVDLMKAGYTGRQLQHLFAQHEVDVARQRSPAARIIRRYELFIATVQGLAAVFGKGDGYDAWLTVQRQQLAHLKAALKSMDGPPSPEASVTMLQLVAAAAQAGAAPLRP